VSEETPQPKTHHVSLTARAQAVASVSAVVITITQPEQLAPALAQRDKTVVIANDEMARRFARFAEWQRSARWGLIAFAVAWLINQAIVHASR
jgi:hypothetical protein